MLATIFFGIGYIFVVSFSLSIFMSPALAEKEDSAEDAGAKKLGA
jgi:hypothetical protein